MLNRAATDGLGQPSFEHNGAPRGEGGPGGPLANQLGRRTAQQMHHRRVDILAHQLPIKPGNNIGGVFQ